MHNECGDARSTTAARQRRARTGPRGFRLAAPVAVTAAVAVLATACGGGSSSTGSSSKTITVQEQAGDNNVATIKSAAKLFEAANPGVKVKIQIITSEAKNSSNAMVLSGSNAPDVGFVPTNSAAYGQLLANKALLPIDDVWTAAKLKSRTGAAITSTLTAPDGKHYVVSTDSVYYSIVYYNKDLFAKAGITAPSDHRITSAAELTSMVAALKKAGKEGLGLGGKSGYEASWMLDALLPTATTSAELQNYLSSWQSSGEITAKYTDPSFVSTLDALNGYAKEGVYQSGFLGTDTPAVEAAFEQGKLGMIIDGSWQAPVYRKDVKFGFGWMLLPPMNSTAKTQLTAYAGDAMAIPAKAKNPALAKKFLEFFMTEANLEQSVVKAGANLASVNLPASAYSALDPLVQEMLADVAKNGAQSGWTSTVPGTLGQAFFDPLIQKMYAGQATSTQIAAQLQTQLATVRSGSGG